LFSDASGIVQLIENDLPEMRRRLGLLESLHVSLDETNLCQACSPNARDLSVALQVEYADEPRLHRVSKVTLDDVRLIQEFDAGADRHCGPMGAETPLTKKVKRLRKLLGLPEKGRSGQ